MAGTAERPRISVYRSNKAIYAQAIDDLAGATLVAARSAEVEQAGDKTAVARRVGHLLAERAKGKGIETVVFDRSGYLYHGRVKALAEGAREGGLQF
jgi:large subunit ribosomal protein L18